MRWLWTVALLGALTSGCAKDSDSDGTPDKDDCEPGDPKIHPEAREVCDGIDNDCNGQVDEDVAIVAYWDRDGDGYGDDAFVRRVCTMPDDGVEVGGDCDDRNEFVNPGADELCDGFDNNCDDVIDDGALITFYEDLDGDGHGTSANTVEDCTPPDGFAPADDDCDDSDPLAWTDAPELCDDHDNDCDGEVDEGLDPTRVWADADGDEFGDPAVPLLACGAKPGFADNDRDCDDGDPAIGPHAEDVQGNGIDEDCDGYVDEYGVPVPFATIDEALAEAPDGSVVQFDEGTFRVLLDIRDRNLTLAGEGCGRTVLLADGLGTVLTMGNGALESLTVSGGTGTEHPTFKGGRTEAGGLLITPPTPEEEGDPVVSVVAVREACFDENIVTKYGGGISVHSGSTLILEDSQLVDNIADHQGGALYVWPNGSAEIRRTAILGNEATKFSGGGVSTQGGAVTIANTVVAGNVSGDDGGGIAIQEDDDGGVVTPAFGVVDHVTFHANAHGTDGDASGAAVFARGDVSLILRSSIFTGHAQRRDVIGDEGTPDITAAHLGFGDDLGADMRSGHVLDAARGRALYVFDDPAGGASRFDMRLRPGSAFVDAGDPTEVDIDGSTADLGAFGGAGAPDDALEGFLDTDGDNMADGAEMRWGTNRWAADATDDDDGDGLSNADELAADTDPTTPDTDGDGVWDDDENANGTDPTRASDNAPTAAAGPDRVVMRLNPVRLDAGGSWDPNGDPLTYAWSLEAPDLSGLSDVADPTAPVTTLTPDVDGEYTLTLTVSDGVASSTDTVVVRAFRGWVVPDNAASLAEAIALASDGDGIGLRPGTYRESVRYSGKELAILGIADDPSEVVIDAAGLGVGVGVTPSGDVPGGLTLANLTVRGAHAGEGGAVFASGVDHVHLSDVVFLNNSAFHGGGALFADAALVTAERVSFLDNFANTGGAVHVRAPRATFDHCTFAGNEAVTSGGAVRADAGSVVLIRNSALSRNTALDGAASAAVGDGATVRYDQSAVIDHRGGSAVWAGAGAAVDLVGSIVAGNRTDGVFAGEAGAAWSAIGNLANDNTGALWHDDAGPVAATPAFAEGDPGVALIALDDSPDDVFAVHLGGASHDAGLASRTDTDGTPADIGPAGVSLDPADARVADFDGDGLEDAWELAFGLDPITPSAAADGDGDGRDAAAERAAGTHPGRRDTDRDGVADGADGLPADEADHRPVITIDGPIEVALGEPVTFTASTRDPDGDAVALEWTVLHIGPESTIDDSALSATVGREVTFTPDTRGVFRLLVTGDDGDANTRAIASVRVDAPIDVPGTFATLEEALDAVTDGDVIALAPGSYDLSLDYEGPAVTIKGAGPDETYLDALPGDRVLTLGEGDNVTFADLTMTGGSGENGGAVYCEDASLGLENVRLEYNIARNGGALYADGCALDFRDIQVVDNDAALSGAGMFLRESELTWVGGEIARNRGTTAGALYLLELEESDATSHWVSNVVFHHNEASGHAGAIFVQRGAAHHFVHNTFVGNDGGLGAIRFLKVEYVAMLDNVFVDNGIRGIYHTDDPDVVSVLESRYNGFWGHTNAPAFPVSLYDDPSNVTDGPPSFVAYDADSWGGWFDDYRLRHDSAYRDVGSDLDPDGTTADLGAFGGAEAAGGFDGWYVDRDGDGMGDDWEAAVGLDPLVPDGEGDEDGDGLSNAVEFELGLDPFAADSDGDGVSDADELDGGSDPADPTDLGPVADAGDDVDAAPVDEPVALSGAASVDGDGDPLSYEWSLAAVPGRSSLTDDDLVGADEVEVTLVPDSPGLYVLELVVQGGPARSAPDTVAVRVSGTVVVPADYASVAEAVHAVVDGDVVRLDDGTWPAHITLDGKDIQLVGSGRDTTILDGGGTGQVVRAVDGETVTISDLTIVNGFGANAGAIHGIGANITLTGVTLRDNQGVLGGAVNVDDSVLTATDIRVYDNLATRLAGGIYAIDSSLVDITQALFADNEALIQYGGAIQLWESDLVLTNAVISGNTAGMGGGVFFTGYTDSPSSGFFDHVTFTLNHSIYHGSAMRVVYADVEVHNSIISHHYEGPAVSLGTEGIYVQDAYTLMYENVEGDWFEFVDPPEPVSANPMFTAIVDDGNHRTEDWSLADGSPAIDGGAPDAPADVDGSAADLGAFGGPLGDWTP